MLYGIFSGKCENMQQAVIKADPRNNTPHRLRRSGYIPGVLNEANAISIPVQFDAAQINKIISEHGPNAKFWIESGAQKLFGFISEVQKHPVDFKLLHVSVQVVEKDQKVKMYLPIVYQGKEELESRFLYVQVLKPEIEVLGNAKIMPDAVIVDVSKKQAAENITSADFVLSNDIKLLDPQEEIYAHIKNREERT